MNNKEESKEQRAGSRDLRATWSVISGSPEFRVSGNGTKIITSFYDFRCHYSDPVCLYVGY